jgi:hypothetical protein
MGYHGEGPTARAGKNPALKITFLQKTVRPRRSMDVGCNRLRAATAPRHSRLGATAARQLYRKDGGETFRLFLFTGGLPLRAGRGRFSVFPGGVKVLAVLRRPRGEVRSGAFMARQPNTRIWNSRMLDDPGPFWPEETAMELGNEVDPTGCGDGNPRLITQLEEAPCRLRPARSPRGANG